MAVRQKGPYLGQLLLVGHRSRACETFSQSIIPKFITILVRPWCWRRNRLVTHSSRPEC